MRTLLDYPTPSVGEEQNRFLSRMLETALSMHKEGEGKEDYKSRTSSKVFETSREIAAPDIMQDVDAFQRIRQRAFSGSVPEGYRAAIRAYFDSLSTSYLK